VPSFLGFGQQPVQSDHVQPGVFGLSSHFGPLYVGDLPDIGINRERGDFDARITAVASEGKRLFERPIDEGFVADGEFHGLWFSSINLQERFAAVGCFSW
jgi:hypothetical protein